MSTSEEYLRNLMGTTPEKALMKHILNKEASEMSLLLDIVLDRHSVKHYWYPVHQIWLRRDTPQEAWEARCAFFSVHVGEIDYSKITRLDVCAECNIDRDKKSPFLFPCATRRDIMEFLGTDDTHIECDKCKLAQGAK